MSSRPGRSCAAQDGSGLWLPFLVAHGLAPDTQALGWRVPGRITAASEALRADTRPDKRALVVRRLVPRGAQ